MAPDTPSKDTNADGDSEKPLSPVQDVPELTEGSSEILNTEDDEFWLKINKFVHDLPTPTKFSPTKLSPTKRGKK
jgi:hypothetical protein